jgi:hypothetical protein
MAEICRNCHADVTEDVAVFPLGTRQRFRCKCGSSVFRYQADEPKVNYTLTVNDIKLLLLRFGIAQ